MLPTEDNGSADDVWQQSLEEVAESEHAPDDGRFDGLRSALIMMVDDESTTTDVLQMYLEHAGYENFVSTTDSTQAMALLEEAQPSVLLLDLMMPQVSGFQILGQIRAHRTLRHTPVIVLTSANDADTKLKVLELGATDILNKPVDPSELSLRLRNTLEARAYQDQLTYFDALTGLPNRRLFMNRLARALNVCEREEHMCTVLRIDIENFKQINDTLGHSAGDALLKAVAHRLEDRLQAGEHELLAEQPFTNPVSVARIGGDEFAVLVPEMSHIDHATSMARRIMSALSEPFYVSEQELFIAPTTGISVYPNDGEDVESLVKHAGVALTHAKKGGRDTYKFYSAKINARSTERLNLENQLFRALDRDELVLHYQPKVDLVTGKIVGSEALLRWDHPERGIVSPDSFIPIAEETGLIVPIGEWVLHAACNETAELQRQVNPDLRVAVNVSSWQLRKKRLTPSVREALASSGLDGGSLTLELTESILMEDPSGSGEDFREVKLLGPKLSIDDFGTGYSSLSYLKRLPLDELKVDRSFINGVPSNEDDKAIVAAIVAMAHSLGLSVVAEGVEDENQLDYLRMLGCNEYQGFFLSRPVPAAQFRILIAADQDEVVESITI